MISLTVEKRYGMATVRIAAPSVKKALGLYKDARIVDPGEDERFLIASDPGNRTGGSSEEPSAKTAA